jgi:hypothetical protein
MAEIVSIKRMLNWLRNAWRFIAGLSALIWVPSFLYWATLDERYLYYPRQENPATSQIVPYEVKGVTVYLTIEQYTQIHWLMMAAIVSGSLVLLATILERNSKPYGSKNRLGKA